MTAATLTSEWCLDQLANLIAREGGERFLASAPRTLPAVSPTSGLPMRPPRTFGAAFSAEALGGVFETELPVEDKRKDLDKIRGRFGDGRGRVQLGSASGSIHVASNEERQR